MSTSQFRRIAGWLFFSAVLLASSAVREAPSSVINQAVIWLPTGVAIAGLWLLGLRSWWLVALVTCVQRTMLGYEWGVTVSAAAGSTFEAVLGVVVLQRLGFRASLSRLRDVAALLAAAAIAPLGSIFCSWIGRSFLWANPNMPFYSGWDGWWRMNALGALTVVPIVLTWFTTPRREFTRQLLVAAGLMAVGMLLLVVGAMLLLPAGIAGVFGLNLVLSAAVLYSASRLGVRGGTLVGTIAAVVVAMLTSRGHGPFLGLPRADLQLALQLFELGFVAIPPAVGALIAERRTAQREGARSDELRRALQAALPDVMYRLRRDGTILEVSVPAGVDEPYPFRELPGRSIYEVLTTEQGRQLEQAAQEAFAQGLPATLEYEITMEGRRRVREARCVRHGDDEILAVVRDITERKWAEGAMAFEARVLGLVAAGHPTADVFVEIVAGIEHFTPGGRASILLLEGRRMHVAMAPSLPAEFNAAIEGVEIGPEVGSCGAAASTGKTVVVRDIATDRLWENYRHHALPHGLRACWSVPIRDSVGTVLGTFAVYYDEPREPEPRLLALAERAAALVGIVLERELRGDALRRSEDLLASINQNVKEGLFRASAGLEVLYANLALARLLGYDAPVQVIGRSLGNAFEVPARLEDLLRLVREQGQWLNEEVLFRRRDGSSFWGLLSGTAVFDRHGEITHYDGAIADITARKELEEQFRQSQKMEAVGKLAGGVAHDFNNLLTVILGYAETIRLDAGGRPDVRAHADHVVDAAKRASGLTRQLLAYSRQQMLSPRVIELNSVVDQMSGMLRRLIGEDVRLVVEHRSGPCWVRVDRSQIEQVLLNLAVNARDAMQGGGTLTIETRMERGEGVPTWARPELGSAEAVVLGVCDSGVGMAPEVQARAFDPFFTTKPPGRGTGLGLSTVHGIVHQSGGAIGLVSAPGLGTSVWIALPRCQEPRPSEEPPAPPADGAVEGTILVVEDEPGVRSLVCATLRREGYVVLEATDGEVALAVSREHTGAIDLVVSDVVMPRMGGRDLASRLLALRPGLPFLFISGYPEDARAPSEFVGGAGAFLAKPFGPDQLLDRVRTLMRSVPAR